MNTEKITLYVGLNDQDTKRQEIATVEAYKIAQNLVCKLCGGGTIYEATGIYTHENGDIVTEKTLRIELFGAPENAVFDLIRQMKTVFNQESIIMQKEITNTVFM